MRRILSLMLAMSCLWPAATDAATPDLGPQPAEIKAVIESYTAESGIDPRTCAFPVWNKDAVLGGAKAMLGSVVATCPLADGSKICTRLAADLHGEVPTEAGCLLGFKRVNFVPVMALSPKGGFFVVVFEADGRPLRLAQQLSLGFGPDRDFCELSAQLVDKEAKSVVGRNYHNLVDLLADPSICRR